MCGICGVYEYASSMRVDRQRLARMNATLMHRGPDEDGFFVRDRVGLAMRRLANHRSGRRKSAHLQRGRNNLDRLQRRNLQLSRAATGSDCAADTASARKATPKSSCTRTKSLACNASSISTACSPSRSTTSDSGGRPPVPRPRPLRQEAPVLRRSRRDADLRFGDQADPGGSARLQRDRLRGAAPLLVAVGDSRRRGAFFKSIRKLPAGHWMLVDERGPEIEPYWSCEPHSAEVLVPEREAVDEVRRLLFRAVEKRLVADVPLGAFLSGGLDSSLVVAIMARLSGRPVKTLSVGFEGPKTHNELPFARRLAEHCGTDHTELTLKPDVVSMVHDLVHYADEPFGISSALPTLLIARARERLTVVLTGDGGDEMFGGYSHYLWERWASAFRRLPRVADSVLLTAAGTLGRRIDGRAALCGVASRGSFRMPAGPTPRGGSVGEVLSPTTKNWRSTPTI